MRVLGSRASAREASPKNGLEAKAKPSHGQECFPPGRGLGVSRFFGASPVASALDLLWARPREEESHCSTEPATRLALNIMGLENKK